MAPGTRTGTRGPAATRLTSRGRSGWKRIRARQERRTDVAKLTLDDLRHLTGHDDDCDCSPCARARALMRAARAGDSRARYGRLPAHADTEPAEPLESLLAGLPIDDEPLTADDLKAIKQGRAEYAAGLTVSHALVEGEDALESAFAGGVVPNTRSSLYKHHRAQSEPRECGCAYCAAARR